MVECPQCRTEMGEEERFCRKCGAILEQTSEEDTMIMRLLSEPETAAPPAAGEAWLWLLDPLGHQVEKAAELSADVAVVGRRPDCAVVLPGNTVSRRHAQVRREGNRYYLSDLGSTNGTLLNGEPVIGEELLSDRDEIAIGTYKLIFRQG